jgi:WD40 repeat protein
LSLISRTIASADEDGTVRLWEPVSRQELLAFRGDAAVTALAFSADGTVLGAGDKDGRVRLWYAPKEEVRGPKS